MIRNALLRNHGMLFAPKTSAFYDAIVKRGFATASSGMKAHSASLLSNAKVPGTNMWTSAGHQSGLRSVAYSRGFSSAVSEDSRRNRAYSWIDEEAESLIAKAYKRREALASTSSSESFPPSLSVVDLEKIGKPFSKPPDGVVDHLALGLMKFLRIFVHAFFREKYDHHAVVLETVAAVPGIVGAFHRHLRSLRRMKRDHGWIHELLQESENERMHLLIFMKVCKPSLLERSLVVAAQGVYLTFYSGLYLVSPRGAHRLTGYLEEEAHRAYTDYLRCIDNGSLPNKPAPEIARTYYNLPESATMRDVVLRVRADEAAHRDVNHHFADKYNAGDLNSPITSMSETWDGKQSPDIRSDTKLSDGKDGIGESMDFVSNADMKAKAQ